MEDADPPPLIPELDPQSAFVPSPVIIDEDSQNTDALLDISESSVISSSYNTSTISAAGQ